MIAVLEESEIDPRGDLGGEDKIGLGGIGRDSRLPCSISTTRDMGGRFEGSVCMHHKLAKIIFLAICSSTLLPVPRSPSSSPSSRRLYIKYGK